ncbi:unnamed protein product [Caretta caretta]
MLPGSCPSTDTKQNSPETPQPWFHTQENNSAPRRTAPTMSPPPAKVLFTNSVKETVWKQLSPSPNVVGNLAARRFQQNHNADLVSAHLSPPAASCDVTNTG